MRPVTRDTSILLRQGEKANLFSFSQVRLSEAKMELSANNRHKGEKNPRSLMAMAGQGISREDIVMSHFSTGQEERQRAPGMVIALASKLQGPVRKLATTDRQMGAPEMHSGHFTFLAQCGSPSNAVVWPPASGSCGALRGIKWQTSFHLQEHPAIVLF